MLATSGLAFYERNALNERMKLFNSIQQCEKISSKTLQLCGLHQHHQVTACGQKATEPALQIPGMLGITLYPPIPKK